METYKPKPIDTSGIELPEEILERIEQLAAHNHDLWAQRRILEGWNYGPERNDDEQTNPNLVPYEELSEPEKEYDRDAVMKTLRAVLALGFRIVKT